MVPPQSLPTVSAGAMTLTNTMISDITGGIAQIFAALQPFVPIPYVNVPGNQCETLAPNTMVGLSDIHGI